MVTETTEKAGKQRFDNDVMAKLVSLDRGALTKIQYRADDGVDSYGMEEPATAYAIQSESVSATAELQIEWDRQEALQELAPALSKLQPIPSDIADKIRLLRSVSDRSQIASIKSELDKEIRQEVAQQDQDRNNNNAELADNAKDAELKKLWSDIGKLQKEVRETMDKACDAGYISKEENQKSKDEQSALEIRMKEIEAMPEGEEKQTALKAFAGQFIASTNHNKHLINKAIASAEKDGNHAIAEELRNALPKIKEEEKRFGKFAQGGFKDFQTPEALPENIPRAAEPAITDTKMAVVHDVTQNDIEAPGGSKDRTGSRSIAKK